MKNILSLLTMLLLAMWIPALAQEKGHEGEKRGFTPKAPTRGPAARQKRACTCAPTPRPPGPPKALGSANFADKPGTPEAPHVDPGNKWVGHATPAGTIRQYHQDRPWEHGHFTGGLRPQTRIRSGGRRASRFWFNGLYFSVAPADIAFANGWLWNSDDYRCCMRTRIIPGYYLAYNTRLGTYAHVLYLGPS